MTDGEQINSEAVQSIFNAITAQNEKYGPILEKLDALQNFAFAILQSKEFAADFRAAEMIGNPHEMADTIDVVTRQKTPFPDQDNFSHPSANDRYDAASNYASQILASREENRETANPLSYSDRIKAQRDTPSVRTP